MDKQDQSAAGAANPYAQTHEVQKGDTLGKIAQQYYGDASLYMQIFVNSQKLFAESLLYTWLNGTQYHTEDEKAQAWSKLEAALGEPNARAVVLTQLHGKVMALLNVAYLANQVLVSPDDDA